MGNIRSKAQKEEKYKIIGDHFETYGQLEQALRDVGLEACQLIVGVDFTKSNLWQGIGVFAYDNLHTISNVPNPYQQVLGIMAKALVNFDDDHLIPAYGFGSKSTSDRSVFSFQYDDQPCHGLEGVLEQYTKIASCVEMSGPTSFTPIIRRAIDIVKVSRAYHILLIIADGGVSDINETINTIVEASHYPLSIVCIGVGKGPWDAMIKMDDDIPKRKFDNFQFVDFHKIMHQCENQEVDFAKHALMEIPLQYDYIKRYLLHQ